MGLPLILPIKHQMSSWYVIIYDKCMFIKVTPQGKK